MGMNTTVISANTGSTVGNAIPLSLNTTVTGSISTYADTYYNVTISNSGLYKFNLTGGSADVYLYIYDSAGNLVDYTGNDFSPNVWIGTVSSGVYIIDVYCAYGPGSYYLTVSPYSWHPGENLAHAISLPLNTTLTGTIPYNYYYNVSLSSNGYYQFNLTAVNTTDFYFNLYSNDGSLLQYSNSPTISTTYYPQEILSNLTAGSYYLNVNSYSSSGSFNVSVYPYAIHPGEDLAHAITIPLNSTLSGSVPFNYYYNFTISNTGYYYFNLTNDLSNSVYFDVYDSSGSYIGSPTYFNTLYQFVADLGTGNYYIEIFGSEASSFNIEFYSYNFQPGENLAHAIPLNQNVTVTDSMPYNSYFNFSISTSGYYKINLTANPSTSIDFTVYDTNGYYVGDNYGYTYPEIADLYLDNGSYYIEVYSSVSTGNFNLTVIPYAYPGIGITHAIFLNENVTYTGFQPLNNYFNVSIATAGEYSFDLNTASTNYFYFNVYASDGTYIGGAGIYPNTYPAEADLKLNASNYYIEVSNMYYSGSFNISYSPYSPYVFIYPSQSSSTTPLPSSQSPSSYVYSSTTQSLKTSPFSTIGVLLAFFTLSLTAVLIRRKKR